MPRPLPDPLDFTPPPLPRMQRALWLQRQWFPPQTFGLEHLDPAPVELRPEDRAVELRSASRLDPIQVAVAAFEHASIPLGTPGSGFGPSGEGFFRLTAFGNADKTVEAVERIKAYFGQNK